MIRNIFPGDVTIDSNANSRFKRHTLRGFSMPAIIPCFPFLSSCQFDLPWIPNPLTTNALPAKLTPNGKIMAINQAEEKYK